MTNTTTTDDGNDDGNDDNDGKHIYQLFWLTELVIGYS